MVKLEIILIDIIWSSRDPEIGSIRRRNWIWFELPESEQQPVIFVGRIFCLAQKLFD